MSSPEVKRYSTTHVRFDVYGPDAVHVEHGGHVYVLARAECHYSPDGDEIDFSGRWRRLFKNGALTQATWRGGPPFDEAARAAFDKALEAE